MQQQLDGNGQNVGEIYTCFLQVDLVAIMLEKESIARSDECKALT